MCANPFPAWFRFPLVRHRRMRRCVERQVSLWTKSILPGLLRRLVPRVIIFPKLEARCAATGSQVGLATGLSGCAAGMFIHVNGSGFVQFCSSLCTGSVPGLVCSDLHGSFSEATHPVGCGFLPGLSLFTPWGPALGYPAWG